MPADPPRLSTEELAHFNDESRRLFVESRMKEDPEGFRRLFRQSEATAREFFQSSTSLIAVTPQSLTSSSMQKVARFLCGPPISQDDFSTLVSRPPNRTTLIGAEAEKAVEVFYFGVNRDLCPWLDEHRLPTEAEAEAAIASVATLMAVEGFRTARRNDASGEQETEVASKLEEIGMTGVTLPGRKLRTLADMPNGTYTVETRIAGKKCDVPVKLWDGRLLALECKVSNSERNGWKRLKSDVVSKKLE